MNLSINLSCRSHEEEPQGFQSLPWLCPSRHGAMDTAHLLRRIRTNRSCREIVAIIGCPSVPPSSTCPPSQITSGSAASAQSICVLTAFKHTYFFLLTFPNCSPLSHTTYSTLLIFPPQSHQCFNYLFLPVFLISLQSFS